MTDEELERYAEAIRMLGEESIMMVLRAVSSAAILKGMERTRELYEREERKVSLG